MRRDAEMNNRHPPYAVWIKPYKIEDLISKIEAHVDVVGLR